MEIMQPLFAISMPGFQEWIVIGIISLIVFGPKKLPSIARTLGSGMREFQKARDEFTAEFHKTVSPDAPAPASNVSRVEPEFPPSPAPVTNVATSVHPPGQEVPSRRVLPRASQRYGQARRPTSNKVG